MEKQIEEIEEDKDWPEDWFGVFMWKVFAFLICILVFLFSFTIVFSFCLLKTVVCSSIIVGILLFVCSKIKSTR